MSGESQSIRKLHVADAHSTPGGQFLAGCICGWEGSILHATFHMADVDSREHARAATLAQVRGERGSAR